MASPLHSAVIREICKVAPHVESKCRNFMDVTLDLQARPRLVLSMGRQSHPQSSMLLPEGL